jgi:hydrogenase nickel incorporation protein HypA/HybF
VHELSLCGAIADIAVRNADERRVEAVHLRIGQLRQVVPDSLAFCWSMVTEATSLEGARLEVEVVAAVLECRSCGVRGGIGDVPTFACAACAGIEVAVISGEEFLVTALDLAST